MDKGSNLNFLYQFIVWPLVNFRISERLRLFWMGLINMYTVHAVSPQLLVRCTSTLPFNGQFIMPNPWWEIVSRATREATYALLYDWWFNGMFLVCYILVTVWCLYYYRKVVERTHVWYLPLNHCIQVSLSNRPKTRHKESKSDQDTVWGEVGIQKSKILFESDHQNLKPPTMIRYPYIEQWDTCHSGDRCTTRTPKPITTWFEFVTVVILIWRHKVSNSHSALPRNRVCKYWSFELVADVSDTSRFILKFCTIKRNLFGLPFSNEAILIHTCPIVWRRVHKEFYST